MEYHPVVGRIINLLSENHCAFETFEHAPVRTSAEAAKVRTGYTLHQGAKALIIKVKTSKADGRFVMLVIPGDLKFDNNKVKQALSVKDTRFATEEEVAAITGGVQVGGVPPFGNLFSLETIADPKIFASERIIFNAGDRSFSVGMKSGDYKLVVNPEVIEIT